MVTGSNSHEIQACIEEIRRHCGDSAHEYMTRQVLAEKLVQHLLTEAEAPAESQAVHDALLDLCSSTADDGRPLVLAFDENPSSLKQLQDGLNVGSSQDQLARSIRCFHQQMSEHGWLLDVQDATVVEDPEPEVSDPPSPWRVAGQDDE